jgi:hypothetical protein
MLGDFHFEPSTGKLTESGKLKVRWIMFEAPEQHREIYVHIAKSQEETEARMAAVNAVAASLSPDGNIPPITQTHISDAGSPADRINMINRKYQSTTPSPRLPAASTAGESAGGS